MITPIDDNDLCSICLEPMESEGSPTAKLHCDHEFHRTCILAVERFYRKKQNNVDNAIFHCPLCRKTYRRRLLAKKVKKRIKGVTKKPRVRSQTVPSRRETGCIWLKIFCCFV